LAKRWPGLIAAIGLFDFRMPVIFLVERKRVLGAGSLPIVMLGQLALSWYWRNWLRESFQKNRFG